MKDAEHRASMQANFDIMDLARGCAAITQGTEHCSASRESLRRTLTLPAVLSLIDRAIFILGELLLRKLNP